MTRTDTAPVRGWDEGDVRGIAAGLAGGVEHRRIYVGHMPRERLCGCTWCRVAEGVDAIGIVGRRPRLVCSEELGARFRGVRRLPRRGQLGEEAACGAHDVRLWLLRRGLQPHRALT